MMDQLSITYAGGTDRGKVREQNEDCILMSAFEHSDVLLLQVADGVGGHEGGEIASRSTVEFMQSSVAKAVLLANSGAGFASDWLQTTLYQAMSDSNQQLIQQQSTQLNLSNMATTSVAILIRENEISLGHLGDSRCYRFNQKLEQLTEDHTALQKLLNEGKINQQEFETMPMHHVISQAMGLSLHPEIEITCLSLQPEDCFILCSDGLTNCMSDAQIQHVLEKTISLKVPSMN
jgi:protein phosphatase